MASMTTAWRVGEPGPAGGRADPAAAGPSGQACPSRRSPASSGASRCPGPTLSTNCSRRAAASSTWRSDRGGGVDRSLDRAVARHVTPIERAEGGAAYGRALADACDRQPVEPRREHVQLRPDRIARGCSTEPRSSTSSSGATRRAARCPARSPTTRHLLRANGGEHGPAGRGARQLGRQAAGGRGRRGPAVPPRWADPRRWRLVHLRHRRRGSRRPGHAIRHRRLPGPRRRRSRLRPRRRTSSSVSSPSTTSCA